MSFGGRQRALLLRSLAPKELYAAVREALSSGDSRSGPTVEDDPSKKGEAVTEDAQARASRAFLKGHRLFFEAND